MSHARRRNDSAYKYLFSSKAIVHQLLTRFVDDKMMSRVRPEDIEPVDKSFVGDAFLDRESDVIYRVNVDGHEVYIYVLIEFQSTVDKSIPIRMLHYILGLYDQMYRTSTAGKLPAVFPILLYNGTERWTVPAERSGADPVDDRGAVCSFL
jgi:predicted transposase/invertase (TIGR01784 family)